MLLLHVGCNILRTDCVHTPVKFWFITTQHSIIKI